MLARLLTLLAFLLMVNVQAGELPPAFTAHYVVKKGPFELGRSVRELRHDANGELIFRSDSDSTGLVGLLFSEHIRETTRMKQVGDRVVPVDYQYRRDGRRKRTISQQFDWQAGQVRSRVDDMEYVIELEEGTLDQSGYQVNLMIDLANGGRNNRYPVVRRDRLRVYDIRHIGDERVDTVLGALDTVVIQRKEDKTTTMWCAPDLHFLPVKIRHEEDGSAFTAYLDSLEGLQSSSLNAPDD